MSPSRLATATLHAVLAVAMILPLAASGVGATPFVSQPQQDQIFRDYGPAAPFGQWQKIKETQTFYLHSNCDTNSWSASTGNPGSPADPTAANCPTTSTGAPDQPQFLYFDSQLPPAASISMDEMTLGLSTFDVAVPGLQLPRTDPPTFAGCTANMPTVLDDTSIFAFIVNFYGTSSGDSSHFHVEFYDVFDNGAGCNSIFIDRVRATAGSFPDDTPNDCAAFNCGAFNSRLFQGRRDVCAVQNETNVVPFPARCSPIYGYQLLAGHGIGVRISADLQDNEFLGGLDDLGNIILNFDSRNGVQNFWEGNPTNFQVVADSSRVNMWTEDRFGVVTDNFPTAQPISGVPSSALDRRIFWKAVQANTWGHQCPVDAPVLNPTTPAPPQPGMAAANWCDDSFGISPVWDGIEEYATVMRIRDMNQEHFGPGWCGPISTSADGQTPSGMPPGGDPAGRPYCYNNWLAMDQTLGLRGTDPGQDETKLSCCNVFNRPIQTIDSGTLECRPAGNCGTDQQNGLQRYQWVIPYTPDLPDGVYQIEFQDEAHGWNSIKTIYVGGAGFEFKFHDVELFVDDTRTIADHLVALGEQTKYSMLLENNGVTTDTYTFAVPVPGAGWSATVSPSSITLPAHGFANVDVLVTPPPTARAGDIKVVSVTATSMDANEVKTVFTRTTYTAARLFGVQLTSQEDLIEARPGLPKLFGMTLHNNGTVADDYVLTVSGQPDGWSVAINPTFTHVLAASRDGISVSVTPDRSAPPGQGFQLAVKACRIADASVCATKEVPVIVYLVHDIALKTLPEAAGGLVRIQGRDAEFDYFTRRMSSGCTPSTTPAGPPPPAGVDCWTRGNRDTKFDNSFTFRVMLENKGDATDLIEMAGAWEPPYLYTAHPTISIVDRSNCDNTNNSFTDGVPDGWRFRILGGRSLPTPTPPGGFNYANPFYDPQPLAESYVADPGLQKPAVPSAPARIAFDDVHAGPAPAGTNWENTALPQRGTGAINRANPAGFSGEYHIGVLELPPQTAQYVWVELFWIMPAPGTQPNTSDPFNCIAEPWHHFLVEAGSRGGAMNGVRENFRSRVPSPDAVFRFSYRSLDEQSIRGNVLLHAEIDPATTPALTAATGPRMRIDSDGLDPLTVHGVLLERNLLQPKQERVPLIPAADGQFGWADFNMIATNTGEEYDNLKIDVDDGFNGWGHQILPLSNGAGIIPTGNTLLAPTPNTMPVCQNPNTNPPPATPCLDRPPRQCTLDPGVAPKHMVCMGMGVYDAVTFQVRCVAPATARVGDYNDMTITVTSDRSNAAGLPIFSRTTVRCIAQGTFDFELENLNRDLIGYPKQTIAFPFTLHNIGLTNDRYTVVLDAHVKPDGSTADPATDSWNPQLSSGAIVAVPTGFDFHGFLSVTIPADVEITDPDVLGEETGRYDHFRLKFQSLDGPAQTSKVLDFTAIVTEEPVLTVTAEPVTIGSNSMDRIVLKAIDCPFSQLSAGTDCDVTGLTHVTFNGYYISEPPAAEPLPLMPRGFDFTCLPGDKDGDNFADQVEMRSPTGAPLPAPGFDPLDPASKPTGTPPVFVPHEHYDQTRGCVDLPLPPGFTLPLSMTVPPCEPPASNGPCANPEWKVRPRFTTAGDAIQQLEVMVPPNQLGISRVAHRIEAEGERGANRYITYTDAIINMKSVYGVSLEEKDGRTTRIVPPTVPGTVPLDSTGTGVLFNVSVKNTGLSPQNVLLSDSLQLSPSLVQAGWRVFYEAAAVQVQPPGHVQIPGPCATSQVNCIMVDPQSEQVVQLGIVAPANAVPGSRASILITGTVQEDPSKVAQLILTAEVGVYGVTVSVSPGTFWIQPQETARYVVTVTNTGTLTENFDLVAAVPYSALQAFEVRWIATNNPEDGCEYDGSIQLRPASTDPVCYIDALGGADPHANRTGESRDVVLELRQKQVLQPTRGGDPGYVVTVSASSPRDVRAQSPSVTLGTIQTAIKVLPFAAEDIDGDGAWEYAIDACTKTQQEGCEPDPADGYETFREGLDVDGRPVGIVSRPAALTQFLDSDALLEKDGRGEIRGESYFLDANGDQHADHLVDVDGDGLPDVLWVPDEAGNTGRKVIARLNFTRDVTGDQLPEMFIDLDCSAISLGRSIGCDGRWDAVFDLARGEFYPLLQAFIDDDAFIDYVIDRNRNGEPDEGETTLLGGANGGIGMTIFNVDMNGDGTMDQAFDAGGADGVPEYFIDGGCDFSASRDVLCASLVITPKDVTGDNRLDWTFDSSGENGRPDAYYDPNCDPSRGTPCSGFIDTQAQFLRDLQKYWLILALFAVALVLFVALLVVTRRR